MDEYEFFFTKFLQRKKHVGHSKTKMKKPKMQKKKELKQFQKNNKQTSLRSQPVSFILRNIKNLKSQENKHTNTF